MSGGVVFAQGEQKNIEGIFSQKTLTQIAAKDRAVPDEFTQWTKLFADENWNKFAPDDLRIFKGTLRYIPSEQGAVTVVMRYNPYKLQGIFDLGQVQVLDVYCGSSQVLAPYVGQLVEIEGKLKEFRVEGGTFQEIWPTRIRAIPDDQTNP